MDLVILFRSSTQTKTRVNCNATFQKSLALVIDKFLPRAKIPQINVKYWSITCHSCKMSVSNTSTRFPAAIGCFTNSQNQSMRWICDCESLGIKDSLKDYTLLDFPHHPSTCLNFYFEVSLQFFTEMERKGSRWSRIWRSRWSSWPSRCIW